MTFLLYGGCKAASPPDPLLARRQRAVTVPPPSRRKFRSRRHRVHSAATGQAQTARVREASQLRDPARIGAKGEKRAEVQDARGHVSLATYMTLPVEQYFVLDPSMITPLGGNRFRLQVPPINVMNVTLRPVAEIAVTTNRNSVVLTTTNCQLLGDFAILESLNDRFCMRFDTTLTWGSGPSGPQRLLPPNSQQNGSAVAPSRVGIPGWINAAGELDVWCEVVAPFNLIPRPMLESACNVVMQALLDNLLPLFVDQLSADYDKWSRDPSYRQLRASRSLPLA